MSKANIPLLVLIGVVMLFAGASIRGAGFAGFLAVFAVSIIPAALGYAAGRIDGRNSRS